MDGVIVDSMPYHYISWYEALRPLGIRVSCFFVYQKEGERWEKTLKELLKKNGKSIAKKDFDRVFDRKQKIFRRYFKRSIFPGAPQILRGLKAEGFALGLVTGTPMAEVRHILPRRLFRMFDAVVSGDMVKRGKPHPDPYLAASRALGIAPSRCLVVENAALGIRSSKRAGMFCCALTTSLPAEYLKGADAVIDDLSELGSIVRKFKGR